MSDSKSITSDNCFPAETFKECMARICAQLRENSGQADQSVPPPIGGFGNFNNFSNAGFGNWNNFGNR